VNQKFYEGEKLLAEISDSLLIVHKGTVKYEYELDALTDWRIFSNESEPQHVVVFETRRDPGQTIGVVWTERAKAEAFRDAVVSAITRL
jgi:hypothetical protein